MSKSLRKGNQKLNELKDKYSEFNFEMTMPVGFGGTYDQMEYNLTEESIEKVNPNKEDEDGSSPIRITDDLAPPRLLEKQSDD